MVGQKVTLNYIVDNQSTPQKLVEMKSTTSLDPEWTAPQNSKTVINIDKYLQRIRGRTLLKKERNDDDDGPGEPTSK